MSRRLTLRNFKGLTGERGLANSVPINVVPRSYDAILEPELEICQNLVTQRDGSVARRAGLVKVANFKTAAGGTFYGSRNGFYISGRTTASATSILKIEAGTTAGVIWTFGVEVWRSTDGTTFTRVKEPPSVGIWRGTVLTDAIGFIVETSTGEVYKTVNGGTAWVYVGKPDAVSISEYYDIKFLSSSVGYMVGNVDTDSTGVKVHIFITADGGATWTAINLNSYLTMGYQIEVIDATHLWICGTIYTTAYKGRVIFSADGGLTWATQYTDNTITDFFSIRMISSSVGWTVGSGGKIIYTANGGTTWTAQTSGTTEILFQIAIANANTAWVVGTTGTILATTNAGTTWTAQISGTSYTLYGIIAQSTSNVWAGGSLGTILKTTNGGTAWSALALGGGYVHKWFIGGNDDNLYTVAESSLDEAVDLGTSVEIPHKMRWIEFSTYIRVFCGMMVSGKGFFDITQAGALVPMTLAWSPRFAAEQNGIAAYAVNPDSDSYRILILFSDASSVLVGSDPIALTAMTSLPARYVITVGNADTFQVNPGNDFLCLKEDGSLWILRGKTSGYLFKLASNLGTPVPYSMITTDVGVFFCTTKDAFLFDGQLHYLTASWKSSKKLFIDIDTSMLEKAVSGYDPVERQFWFTYKNTEDEWKTWVYQIDKQFWWRFKNALFKDGSFYNKGTQFYLSLIGNTTFLSPGLYLYGDYAASDPDDEIDCEFKPWLFSFAGQSDKLFSVEKVFIKGKGWTELKFQYVDINGTLQTSTSYSLDHIIDDEISIKGDELSRIRQFTPWLTGTGSSDEDEPSLEELIIFYDVVESEGSEDARKML